MSKRYSKKKNTSADIDDYEEEEKKEESEEESEEEDRQIIPKSVKTSNEIFAELIKRQIPDVPPQWKLQINDMKRICKYINNSIFDEHECCPWKGYITNINNTNKGTYVNFYFRNKKVALHRLLYSNFVAPLDSTEYLKFNCESNGICCNVNHYEKYKYSKSSTGTKKSQKPKETKKEPKEIGIKFVDTDLYIDFD